MKIGKYAIILLIWSFLCNGLALAGPEHMLSPAIMINSQTFVQQMSFISEQLFVDPSAPLSEKIKQSRMAFTAQSRARAKQDFSLWPKFFLKNVLNDGTNNLKSAIQELIQWMESDSFKQIDDIERLGYIEDLAQKLTPFERILFYEGVYFVEPGSSDLGFSINTKQDWCVSYFYKKTFFAHGAVYEGSRFLELSFGDDLARRNLPKIKHVHYYVYMKRLVNVYIENPGKFLIINNDQLLSLASHTNQNFLAQSLNFYLLKVGGFMPEYHASDGLARQQQLEDLSQLKDGKSIDYDQAMKIIENFGLHRNIPAEEEQYLAQAYKQNHRSSEVSRNILSLPNNESKKSLSQYKTDIQKISQIEIAVDAWNIYFVKDNGEKELFLEEFEETYIPVYDQLILDIENYISQHNQSGLEEIHWALLRKNNGALPFWKGMDFRIVVKELMLNAIRAVRKSEARKGKVVVNAKIDKGEFIISICDNGMELKKEIELEEKIEPAFWGGTDMGFVIIKNGQTLIGKKLSLFDEGFTTKDNDWGLNGYGLYYSRLFVENILNGELDLVDGWDDIANEYIKDVGITIPLGQNLNHEFKLQGLVQSLSPQNIGTTEASI